MFKNMKLGLKVGIGFGVVLALLAIASIMSFNALNTAAEGFEHYRELARNTNNSGRVQANVLSMRLSALGYYNTSDEKSLKQEQERYDLLTKLFVEAKEGALNDEMRGTYDEMARVVQEYSNTFEEIVKLINQRHRLVTEQLDVIGPDKAINQRFIEVTL